MTLQIHDPRAEEMAERLARLRDVSVDDAVVDALEKRLEQASEVERAKQVRPLAEIAGEFGDRLRALSKGPGRVMTKDEIDAMWGQ
jgi:antitoxin VapB